MFLFDEIKVSPSRSGDTTCRIFGWVGQTFESCENCGLPYWVNHLYDPAYGGTKGQLRVKHYIKYDDAWIWREVNVISPEDREATRAKWEGYNTWAVRQAQFMNYP